ncbi:MAG TPA: carboxypeptidase-like regulatory domain-containing protein [bacterium]|jgi:hypothetical protein
MPSLRLFLFAMLTVLSARAAEPLWVQDDCYMRYNPDKTGPGRSTLVGYVFDKDRNLPIRNAEIALAADFVDSTGGGHTCCCYRARSNEQGRYAVQDIAPGYRTLSVTADGYWTYFQEITITQDTARIANFELSAATPHDSLLSGSVTGRVWDAVRRLPLAGVTVSDSTHSALTDADGVFLLPNLSPGGHILSFTHPGYILEQHLVIITTAFCSEDVILKPMLRP